MNATETYKIFAKFYDYYVRNFKSDFDFYISEISKNDHILEIGCGTGRILQFILDLGHKITGVDISDEMLKIASQKLKNHLKKGNLTLLNYNFLYSTLQSQFTKVIISFYTFNYILENQILFLENVYQSMVENSYLLMDLFYPKTLNQKALEGKWTIQNIDFNGTQMVLNDKRWMEKNIENRLQIFSLNNKKVEILTKRRYYSPSEVEKILQRVGFRNIKFAIGYNRTEWKSSIEEYDLNSNFLVKAKKQPNQQL